ncbi:MAG: hypothetical protein ISS59_01530 [Desulfobacteraceae bacterium]|nr:hypothetical protein [Desulfobacteraceae bacterium]
MTLKGTKEYAYLFAAVALSILFFYPVLFSDKTFYLRDIHQWFYPMKFFLANSLKAGSIPFWCPNYFCGSPFMSDIQSGVFYPISLVFLLFPFSGSFNIYIVIHFILGFCFFYQFIIGLGLSRKSALITSISFCYGSFTISSVNTLNNLSTLIWLPAVLWSFQRATTKHHISGYFLTVVFLCMAALGGAPQLFIFITGLLFLFGITQTGEAVSLPRSRLKNATIILLLTLFSLLLTMVQLGPTYLDYQQSLRLGGLSYDEARIYSLDLSRLKHLFFPPDYYSGFVMGSPADLKALFSGDGEMPWLLTIYPGLIITILALFGMIFSFSGKLLLWIVILVVAIILALGDTTPAHFFFYKIFPFFRFPEKFMLLANFSLLVMSANGLDRIFSILTSKGIRHKYFFYLIVLILIGDLFSAHRYINPVCESVFYRFYDPMLQPIMDDRERFRVYVDPESTLPASVADTIVNHHIGAQRLLVPQLGILQNIEYVDGQTPLKLLYQHIIRDEILSKPWDKKIRFLRLANVKYIISSKPLDKDVGLMQDITRLNDIVYKVSDELPRAWMVGQLLPIRQDSVDELIRPSFNPAFSALTKGEVVNKYNSPWFKKIDIVSYKKHNTIHIELTADAPGVLVVTESSYPKWRVFVDRVEKKCLYLNFFFLGVEMDTGKHKIVLQYRPRNYHLFLFISLASLGLFVLVWMFYLPLGRSLKQGKELMAKISGHGN